MVRQLGCHLAQGFFFGRPAPSQAEVAPADGGGGEGS